MVVRPPTSPLGDNGPVCYSTGQHTPGRMGTGDSGDVMGPCHVLPSLPLTPPMSTGDRTAHPPVTTHSSIYSATLTDHVSGTFQAWGQSSGWDGQSPVLVREMVRLFIGRAVLNKGTCAWSQGEGHAMEKNEQGGVETWGRGRESRALAARNAPRSCTPGGWPAVWHRPPQRPMAHFISCSSLL